MAGSWADATKLSVDVERWGRKTMARPYDSVPELTMDAGRQPALDT